MSANVSYLFLSSKDLSGFDSKTYPIQQLTICHYGFSIANGRVQIPPKRDIELSLRIDTIQAIEASTIQEHQILGTVNGIQIIFVENVHPIGTEAVPFPPPT